MSRWREDPNGWEEPRIFDRSPVRRYRVSDRAALPVSEERVWPEPEEPERSYEAHLGRIGGDR